MLDDKNAPIQLTHLSLVRSLRSVGSESGAISSYRSFLKEIFGPDLYGQIWYRDLESPRQPLVLLHEWGYVGDRGLPPRLHQISIGHGIVGTVSANGEALALDMADQADRSLAAAPNFVDEQRFRTLIAVPWRLRPAGVVLLALREESSAVDELQAAAELGRDLLVETSRLREARLSEVVASLVDAMGSVSSEAELLQHGLGHFAELVRSDRSWLLAEHSDGSGYRIAASLPAHDGSAEFIDGNLFLRQMAEAAHPLRLFDAVPGTASDEFADHRIDQQDVEQLLNDLAPGVSHGHLLVGPVGPNLGSQTPSNAIFVAYREATRQAFLPGEGNRVKIASSVLARTLDQRRATEMASRVRYLTGDVISKPQLVGVVGATMSALADLLAPVVLFYATRADAPEDWNLELSEPALGQTDFDFKSFAITRMVGTQQLVYQPQPSRPTVVHGSVGRDLSTLAEVLIPIYRADTLVGTIGLLVAIDDWDGGMMDTLRAFGDLLSMAHSKEYLTNQVDVMEREIRQLESQLVAGDTLRLIAVEARQALSDVLSQLSQIGYPPSATPEKIDRIRDLATLKVQAAVRILAIASQIVADVSGEFGQASLASAEINDLIGVCARAVAGDRSTSGVVLKEDYAAVLTGRCVDSEEPIHVGRAILAGLRVAREEALSSVDDTLHPASAPELQASSKLIPGPEHDRVEVRISSPARDLWGADHPAARTLQALAAEDCDGEFVLDNQVNMYQCRFRFRLRG